MARITKGGLIPTFCTIAIFFHDFVSPLSAVLGAFNPISADLDDVKNISKCGFYLAQGSRCANRPDTTRSVYWAIFAFKTHSTAFFPLLAISADGSLFYYGLLSGNNLYWHKVATATT